MYATDKQINYLESLIKQYKKAYATGGVGSRKHYELAETIEKHVHNHKENWSKMSKQEASKFIEIIKRNLI